MGTVLSFQPRTKRASTPMAVAATTPAVVIFPGVRYERLSPGDMTAPPKVLRTDLTTQPTLPARS